MQIMQTISSSQRLGPWCLWQCFKTNLLYIKEESNISAQEKKNREGKGEKYFFFEKKNETEEKIMEMELLRVDG